MFSFLVEGVVIDFEVGEEFLGPKRVVSPDAEANQCGPDADSEANPETGAKVQQHLLPIDHQVTRGAKLSGNLRPKNNSREQHAGADQSQTPGTDRRQCHQKQQSKLKLKTHLDLIEIFGDC